MKQKGELIKIAALVEKELGLHFESNRIEDVERGILAALYEINIEDTEKFISNLATASSIEPLFLKVLSSYLTIGETYFFREKPAMSLFIKMIMPEVIRIAEKEKRPIKIWSAGCSSGEEPYSLAIIIKENFPGLNPSDFSIMATDISPKAINKAISGIYTEWSFRETPDNIRKKYFLNNDGTWSISPDIKRLINFTYLNLAKESFTSQLPEATNVDIIFCRNVLMYLSPVKIKSAAENFYNCLNDGGWFITSQVELNDEYFSLFDKVYFESGVFYKKIVSGKRGKKGPFKNYIDEILLKTHAIGVKPERKITKEINRETKSKFIARHNISPHSAETENELEKLYLAGKYKECITACLKVLEKGKNDHNLLSLLAKCYANSGNYKQAVIVLDKMVSSGLSDEDIFYLYGTVLHEQNEIDKAKDAFKKGLYLNQDHLLSHLMMGNIMNQEGKRSIANKHYSNVLEILGKWNSDDIIPGSGGLTKARLNDIVENLLSENEK
jgi:chemotaxis protein methyltransferase CheR